MLKTLRPAVGHAARVVLGLVFLLAGAAKAVDPAEFAFEMASYGLVGKHFSAVAAPLLIAFEITLGTALLLGVRTRAMAIVSSLMIPGFIGVKAYALSSGRTDPCGCFGAYLETSPGWGIAIDFGFLAAALLTWRLAAAPAAARRGRAPTLAVTALLSLGLALASPRLPIDRLVTSLSAGRTLKDLALEGKVPAEGRHLVALLDLTDPGAARTAADLNGLVSQPGAPPVVALTPSTEGDRAAFTWSANPSFEIVTVDRPILKRLYRSLPRFFLVAAGRVVAVYDGAPPAARDLISSEAP